MVSPPWLLVYWYYMFPTSLHVPCYVHVQYRTIVHTRSPYNVLIPYMVLVHYVIRPNMFPPSLVSSRGARDDTCA